MKSGLLRLPNSFMCFPEWTGCSWAQSQILAVFGRSSQSAKLYRTDAEFKSISENSHNYT